MSGRCLRKLGPVQTLSANRVKNSAAQAPDMCASCAYSDGAHRADKTKPVSHPASLLLQHQRLVDHPTDRTCLTLLLPVRCQSVAKLPANSAGSSAAKTTAKAISAAAQSPATTPRGGGEGDPQSVPISFFVARQQGLLQSRFAVLPCTSLSVGACW